MVIRKAWRICLLLIPILFGVATYKYLNSHPSIGEWEERDAGLHMTGENTSLKLWVFKDNTAVYQNYGSKSHCKWSEKAGDFIVLLCADFLRNGNDIVLNFKTDPDQTGYLEGSNKMTMRRVEIRNIGKKEIASYPPSLWKKGEDVTLPLSEDSESPHSAKKPISPLELRAQMEKNGYGSFVTTIQNLWESDPDKDDRDAIEGLMGDNTVLPAIKKAALQSYALTGSVLQGLTDRYIQKSAAIDDNNTTVEAQKHQDWIIANLRNRKAQMDIEQRLK